MTREIVQCRILIVEDNPADIHLMKEALRIADAADVIVLETAKNGDEALKLLSQRQSYDAILLDLNMPKLGGREFLSCIRQQTRAFFTPIVIFSNSDYHLDIQECRRLGAEAYFQKPNDFDHLVDLFASFSDCLRENKRINVPWISERYTERTHGCEINKFTVRVRR